jgi:hypothetical protein
MGRLRHEAGQTVVLIAVLLPLFLGLGAIAVDIGYWYVVKKTAQDAADAAALAAAAELPDKFAAEQAAMTYVGANMPEASWSVEYPYVPDADDGVVAGVDPTLPEGVPDPTKVKVVVEQRADTFFGRIFGLLEAVVSSRAVAERLNTDGNAAIFAFSADCSDALALVGNMDVNGYVHSNGQYSITPDPDAPRWWAADGTRVDCGASVNPHGTARFGGTGYDDPTAGTLPRELSEERGWPTWVTAAQLGIAWPSGCPDQWSWETSDSTIPPGVYCAKNEIRIDADNVIGRVTLVAPRITVTGDGQDLAPYIRRVLFFSPPNSTADTADDSVSAGCPGQAPDMELGGERYTWAGTIFNPCGRVRIAVGEPRSGTPHIVGTVLARQVNVDGDGFAMIGRSNFDVIPEVALSE